MKMRKYSMTGQRVAQLKRLLRNDKIDVRRIVVAAHEKREDSVYVFYEHVEEQEKNDNETLERLKVKAEEVAEDRVYPKLTNAKQRELHLLDCYGLSKRESVDVIELVKMIEIGAKIESEEERIKKEERKDEIIQGFE